MPGKESLEEAVVAFQKLLDIQLSDGNWNYDEYQFGMANGMILAVAVMTGEDPDYKDKPNTFLRDLETLDKLSEMGVILSDEAHRDTDS